MRNLFFRFLYRNPGLSFCPARKSRGGLTSKSCIKLSLLFKKKKKKEILIVYFAIGFMLGFRLGLFGDQRCYGNGGDEGVEEMGLL